MVKHILLVSIFILSSMSYAGFFGPSKEEREAFQTHCEKLFLKQLVDDKKEKCDPELLTMENGMRKGIKMKRCFDKNKSEVSPECQKALENL